jgi:hypothetical protein
VRPTTRDKRVLAVAEELRAKAGENAKERSQIHSLEYSIAKREVEMQALSAELTALLAGEPKFVVGHGHHPGDGRGGDWKNEDGTPHVPEREPSKSEMFLALVWKYRGRTFNVEYAASAIYEDARIVDTKRVWAGLNHLVKRDKIRKVGRSMWAPVGPAPFASMRLPNGDVIDLANPERKTAWDHMMESGAEPEGTMEK